VKAGQNITAILSMLHEGSQRNSGTRRFRNEPVLRWTLDRLSRSKRVTSTAILCWEDQVESIVPLAEHWRADVLVKGPRSPLPELESVAAARRWADGWRGGLLGTCEFDRGFHAAWTEELAEQLHSAAVVLIDPAAGLVDPNLVDDLITHAGEHPEVELCFMPAAPGLSSVLIRRELLKRLAAGKSHPGRLLHYTPDAHCREPLTGDACAPVPTAVARTTDRFTLDSDRQLERITTAMLPLNGQLMSSPSEAIVARMRDTNDLDAFPREIVLELNTARASRPVYWPGKYQAVERPGFSLGNARRIFEQFAGIDDLRLTIAGLGDPLLSENLFPILGLARDAGVAVHVETDLLVGDVKALANSDVDIVSFHASAVTPQTYASVMGIDHYKTVLENVRLFVTERARRARGVPLLVPTFTKCRDNLAEMEAWYDQWLRAIGTAVIVGPSDFAGQIPDTAVVDMTPPRRRPCSRLWSRMVIRSTGDVVLCEQDFAGRNVLGNVAETPISEIWQKRMAGARADHVDGAAGQHPLCGKCREWNRP
jgi:radical SAM protein with 4Fe4S-binding SPASM domain